MPHDRAPRTVTTADGRVVGYRRLGHGAPVVLLHASPRSAAALLPLAERLAERFTVFAFDTPGFGYSDPLPLSRPDAWDYAEALIAVFDALGIDHAPVYGSHTGAAIAVAAALSHPTRVPALVLDGYAIFSPVEAASHVSSYLAPIRPDWEGAWLAWLWSRVKDQFTFFPWNLRAQAARIARPLVPDATLQAVVVDFLAAGDAYRPAYAAAFRFPGLDALRRVGVPCAVIARGDDLLVDHLQALTELPACVSVQRLPADDAAQAAAVIGGLVAGATGSAPEPPATRLQIGHETAFEVLRVPGGTVGVRRTGSPSGKPLVLLPPIPGSARGCADLARGLASEGRAVFTMDLPGFGASTATAADNAEGIAAGLAAALAGLGLSSADMVAMGESAAVGHALAQHRLLLLDPVPEAERAATVATMPDIAPLSHGGHLLAAWHCLRDRTLWRPHHRRDPAHALEAGTDPDLARLHAELTDWMRGGTAGRATLEAALAAPLPAPRPDTAVLATEGHPWAAGLPCVPTDMRQRAAGVLAALDGGR